MWLRARAVRARLAKAANAPTARCALAQPCCSPYSGRREPVLPKRRPAFWSLSRARRSAGKERRHPAKPALAAASDTAAGAGAVASPAKRRAIQREREGDEGEYEEEKEVGDDVEDNEVDDEEDDEIDDEEVVEEEEEEEDVSAVASAGAGRKLRKAKVVDEWTTKEEKLIASQWKLFTECVKGLRSDKAAKALSRVKATVASVINECREGEHCQRADAREKLRLINEAVAKVSTDSGDAVARIGELRL